MFVMTPRRRFLRPSLFAVLALVTARVPACEYGSPHPDQSQSSGVARAIDIAPAFTPEDVAERASVMARAATPQTHRATAHEAPRGTAPEVLGNTAPQALGNAAPQALGKTASQGASRASRLSATTLGRLAFRSPHVSARSSAHRFRSARTVLDRGRHGLRLD